MLLVVKVCDANRQPLSQAPPPWPGSLNDDDARLKAFFDSATENNSVDVCCWVPTKSVKVNSKDVVETGVCRERGHLP